MTRLAAKPLDQYPWWLRLLFSRQKRTYGEILGPGLQWGRSPTVFAAFAGLYAAFERKSSPLSPQLRSLVMVRVSQINHCAFCIDMNSATLLKRDIPISKLENLPIWSESDLYTEQERLALEYAETMSDSGARVTDKFIDLMKKHWTDDQIVELTGLIAFQNMSAKFNSALDIPPQGLCLIPSKHEPAQQS
jgi:AhpD family alkylhydroperoxidase